MRVKIQLVLLLGDFPFTIKVTLPPMLPPAARSALYPVAPEEKLQRLPHIGRPISMFYGEDLSVGGFVSSWF